jgi:hypothetical protein
MIMNHLNKKIKNKINSNNIIIIIIMNKIYQKINHNLIIKIKIKINNNNNKIKMNNNNKIIIKINKINIIMI